jgi:hypothetical protein
VSDQAAWPGEQLDPVAPELLLLTLRRTTVALGPSTLWRSAIEQLPTSLRASDRSALLYLDPAAS